MGVEGETDLLEIVLALRTRSGFANLSGGGHKQADQHGDDREDHQELDEREGATLDHGKPPT
jgi:hypothetical protein